MASGSIDVDAIDAIDASGFHIRHGRVQIGQVMEHFGISVVTIIEEHRRHLAETLHRNEANQAESVFQRF